MQLWGYQCKCLATVIQLFVKLLYHGQNLCIQNLLQLFVIAFTWKKRTYYTQANFLNITCYWFQLLEDYFLILLCLLCTQIKKHY